MNTYEQRVLQTCAQAGRILLESGAETPRIEETVEIIGKTAGVSVSCYVTLTAVFVSLADQPTTQLTKTKLGSFNLQKVGADVKIMDRFFRHRELPDSENFSKPGFHLKTA